MSTQYRVPVLENFEWQQNVISQGLNTPPSSPVKGDRYIVGASPTGAWSGKAKNIAWYDGAAWKFDAPTAGWQSYVTADSAYYFYTGTAWTVSGSGDMNKSVYDTDNDGIVDKAENVDDGAGNASTAAQVKDAVTKAHTQNTDQYVDFGGASQTSASQIKESYDKRGNYDSDLKAVLFNL